MYSRCLGTYHGVDVLGPVDDTLHQHRLRAIILEELLHLRRQLGVIRAADRVNTHRLREQAEVRVRHAGMRVTVLVEEVCGETSAKVWWTRSGV